MKILVSGSSGLVGTALRAALQAAEHEVWRLVRRAPGEREVQWSAEAGALDPAAVSGFDAVVHLAGENIASKRWSAAQKARISDSRLGGTARLSDALAACAAPPRVLVAGSAIGFYGDCGDTRVDEVSPRGTGFLADVCSGWEAACEPAKDAGIRVVNLRTGMVLSPDGGALPKILTPMRLGAGGVIGNGKQWQSWIALDDLVGAILHVLTDDSVVGPVNCVAPNAVRNFEFTKTLGRVLRRPTIFPLPAFAARLLLGEMADELLLSSAHVHPQRLVNSGFTFQFPKLEGALRHLLAAKR